jgi:uncharacterized membrane protein (DUF441 family)
MPEIPNKLCSCIFSPITAGVLAALGTLLHFRSTADLLAEIVGPLVAYLLSQGILLLIISSVFMTTRTFRGKLSERPALLVILSLALAYSPVWLLTVRIFLGPI